MFVGQKGDHWATHAADSTDIDSTRLVSAGKLRRYSGEGWRQLLDIKTQLANIRDMLRTVAGIWQSYRIMVEEKPDVVFTRGGFVSVPVALAARLRKIPYITHDADSVPSLANRIIARWAAKHAVALPAATYPYQPEKIVVTGIPVAAEFGPVSPDQKHAYRKELDLREYEQVVLVTGGGNGARALNMLAVANAKYLLTQFPDLAIVHFTGRSLKDETEKAYQQLALGGAHNRILVYDFVTDFYKYSGAADVIVARGGMSSLAEFALQKKACVLVPSPQLGWNVKNSATLARAGAVKELSEAQAEQPDRLGHTIGELLRDAKTRSALENALGNVAQPDATRAIVRLIIEVGSDRGL